MLVALVAVPVKLVGAEGTVGTVVVDVVGVVLAEEAVADVAFDVAVSGRVWVLAVWDATIVGFWCWAESVVALRIKSTKISKNKPTLITFFRSRGLFFNRFLNVIFVSGLAG